MENVSYIVQVYDDQGNFIPAQAYYYDSTGAEIGASGIQTIDGTDLTINAAWPLTTSFVISAIEPGYKSTSILKSQLQANNYVYLEKKRSYVGWVIAAAIAGLLFGKVKF